MFTDEKTNYQYCTNGAPCALPYERRNRCEQLFPGGNGFEERGNQSPAQQEFDAFVHKLREVGVKVIGVDDIYEQNTPDSVFPNNWITFQPKWQRSNLPYVCRKIGVGERR